MSATPDPAAPATAPTAPATPTAPGKVPRWLLITIVAVVVVAVGIVAALLLTRGGEDDAAPAPDQPLPADVTAMTAGLLTVHSPLQLDLDSNHYIYRGTRCYFSNPASRFDGNLPETIACFLIFVPDSVVLEGRDIVVKDGTLTIAENAAVLDRPGCPDVGAAVALPEPGTRPGPPVACVRTNEGGEFAIFVTAMSVDGPVLAVVEVP